MFVFIHVKILITPSCCHVQSACAKCGNLHYYIPLNELCGFRGDHILQKGNPKQALIRPNKEIQFCAKEMQTKFGVFRSLISRNEISSKRSRIFVNRKFRCHLGEISCCQNFAKFPQNFAIAKIRIFAMETGCNENLACVAWRFCLGA